MMIVIISASTNHSSNTIMDDIQNKTQNKGELRKCIYIKNKSNMIINIFVSVYPTSCKKLYHPVPQLYFQNFVAIQEN